MMTLHYGKRQTALAEIVADEAYPAMYRVRWPNGDISDMVNLSRAKDAAIVLARHYHPELAKREGDRFRWKVGETPPEAGCVR
jgi:hypothetical protein